MMQLKSLTRFPSAPTAQPPVVFASLRPLTTAAVAGLESLPEGDCISFAQKNSCKIDQIEGHNHLTKKDISAARICKIFENFDLCPSILVDFVTNRRVRYRKSGENRPV